ncbi:MAG: hypothetical protein GU362_06215 [Thaumarchaeota archaeon]|nr:hypothetical protein [Nitrososphaerota archaeon]
MRKAVSSTLAGLIVIGIALASIFTIYALYLNGLLFVSRTNQQTLFLEYKAQERLALVVSGSNLTVINEWAHPSKIVDLLEIDPSNNLHTVPVSVEILPRQNYTFVNLLQSGWKYAVLTFYGNEFWAPYGMINPASEMYTLTMSVYPSGAGQTTPAVGTYVLPYGTVVHISETPVGNNLFLYWVGSGYQSYSGTSQNATIYIWGNITETAYYGYKITFNATGLGSDAEGTVLVVNGNSYSYSQLPVTVDVPGGQSVSYSFYSPVYSTINGKRYVWVSTTGLDNKQSDTFTPTQSGSIIGNYETQYELIMSVYPSGAGSTTPSGSSWYNAGSNVKISATANSGYQFASWSGSGSSSYSGTSNPVTITMNSPVNETAIFNIEVIIQNTFGGSASASYNGQTYQSNTSFYVAPNSQVTFTASPNQGYFFDKWVGTQSSTNNPLNLTITQPTNETAEFGFYITFSTTGLGSNAEGTVLSVDGQGYTYSQLPVTIAVNYGQSVSYSFYSPVYASTNGVRYVWVSTSGLDNKQTDNFIPHQSGDVIGNYASQYELIMSVYPSGAGTTNPSGTTWYNAGTNVQISATPNAGYMFASWSGVGTISYSGTNNPATVTMNSPINETANFGIQVTIQNTFGGIATASYNGQTYYSNTSFFVTYGSQVTFTASADQGYFFDMWTGTVQSSSATLTVIITSPTSETAEFGYYITFGVSGMNSSAQGTVLTLDGNTYTYSQLPVTIAVNYGQSVSYSFSSPVSTSLSDLQFVWVSTSGLDNKQSDTFTPHQAGSVIGNYESEYFYYFNQTGIPSNGPDWTLNVNGQTYTLTPTQTLKIVSTSSSLSWTAYNTSTNGVVYYPSPSSGTAHPGTNTIHYNSEVTATGISNEFVLVLNPKFWFFLLKVQVEYVMLIVSLLDAVPELGLA